MNHSILQSQFPLDGPITSDGDYSGAQRQFPGPTGFSMDEEDIHRRSSAVGNHLAQTVPIPASNGLRYSTQQSAMPDLPYGNSSAFQLLSPTDSGSGAFPPGSFETTQEALDYLANVGLSSFGCSTDSFTSAYTHSSGLGYDRMPDFRSHRVPTLQPPTSLSSTVPSSGNAPLLGRGDTYPGSYSTPRGAFPSLTSLSEIGRGPQYSTSSRPLDCVIDRTSNVMYGPGTMYIDQRGHPPAADAPPFTDTTPIHNVISGNQIVRPEIAAKIHKGFFQVDDKWTCYRRNYFSISCSFSFPQSVHGPFLLKIDNRSERIHQFAMSISAIVNGQHNEIRELVQHTPKRDKQSERQPQRVILQPAQTAGMVPSLGSTSTSGHPFSLMSQPPGIEQFSAYGGAPQQPQPPTQHTFERIQFQKATANNGKRRAQQQYYNLVVDLYAEIPSPLGVTEWVKIARRLSHPMVVRGRSPGHYKDGRRDSSTSMGPDGGSGGAGDGGGGSVMHPLGQGSRSHISPLLPFDSGQRGGHGYGRTDYHQMATADQSPLSASPHISSSSSSTFDINMMNDPLDPMDSMRGGSNMDSYQNSNYGMGIVRKDNHFRNPLPSPYEYDTVPRTSESSDTSFTEAYNPLASVVPNDPGDSQFLKHESRMASHSYHHSGYDTIYSPRSGNGSGSGSSPYYRLPSSQSLCT